MSPCMFGLARIGEDWRWPGVRGRAPPGRTGGTVVPLAWNRG